MTEPKASYATDEQPTADAPPVIQVKDEAMRSVLYELRRALITQLRSIEVALGIEQSIPARRRPH